MRKRHVWQIYLFSLLCVFIACDDNENNEEENVITLEVDGLYSNKSAAALTTDSLLLTYNGETVYGKEVYFKLTSEDVADLTLFGVLPGEKEQKLANVSLVKKSEGYHFTGSGISENGTSFEYTGEVEAGRLLLAMENVKVKESILSATTWSLVQTADREDFTDTEGTYRYYHRNAYILWYPVPKGSVIIEQVPAILRSILEKLLLSTIQDVSFSADGNVTATYALLPETSDFVADFISGEGYPDRPAEDWNVSSRNLINYYVKDSKVYVIPNAEMIIEEIQGQIKSSRADDSSSGVDINFDEIMEAYTRITEWCTTGIELEIREIPAYPVYNPQEDRRVQYAGDIMLVLDKSALEPFLPLLSLVKALLSEDVLDQIALNGLTVGQLIDVIMDGLINAEALEIGICLNKDGN